jgi:hypothetical protein
MKAFSDKEIRALGNKTLPVDSEIMSLLLGAYRVMQERDDLKHQLREIRKKASTQAK